MDLRNRAEASGDGHDESILNPEMPNETDLTKKEKRQIEREKLKGMGTGKKLQYIWMYYKVHMLCVVLAIGAVCLGVNLYQHAKMETVLSIAVVNAGDFTADEVEKNILDLLNTDNKYAQVSVAQNLMTDETGEDFDYYARIAYVTEIQSATVDVLIMPKELYEHEKDSGMYANLRETFGDEVFESLGAVDDQHLELDGSSSVAQDFGLRYDPVCICLPGNVKNKENALKWIQSVLK
ncbi:hypothetical protein [Blautia schinkii]|uniref:hypothetical protein n=1 Tax=Blautia schinkii TaxID=180164 RepID=UPI001570CD48|nr:hypothetical protein [Blautia schinkii]NSK34285.1 hypothetical protein [Blautia schinkii]NSK64929.1 hypothetical protein [Blautia schinkii]